MIRVELNGTKGFALAADTAKAQAALDTLVKGTGAGNDFIGWVDLPVNYDREEFARIQKAAKKIQSDSQALVVIGIGGSYLGARAVIELLRSPNYNALAKSTPDVYFAGNGISGDALSEVIAMIGDRERAGPRCPVHRALRPADVAHALGKRQLLRLDPAVLCQRQRRQRLFDLLPVHRFSSLLWFSVFYCNTAQTARQAAERAKKDARPARCVRCRTRVCAACADAKSMIYCLKSLPAALRMKAVLFLLSL